MWQEFGIIWQSKSVWHPPPSLPLWLDHGKLKSGKFVEVRWSMTTWQRVARDHYRPPMGQTNGPPEYHHCLLSCCRYKTIRFMSPNAKGIKWQGCKDLGAYLLSLDQVFIHCWRSVKCVDFNWQRLSWSGTWAFWAFGTYGLNQSLSEFEALFKHLLLLGQFLDVLHVQPLAVSSCQKRQIFGISNSSFHNLSIGKCWLLNLTVLYEMLTDTKFHSSYSCNTVTCFYL